MKKSVLISMAVLAGLFFYAACSPDNPLVFDKQAGIYFAAEKDSISYSFAKYPKRTSDTLRIPVKVVGNVSSTDKTFSLEAVSGAGINAMEGKHFKILNPYTMPGGQLSTTVPVVIYRTPDMDTIIYSFGVQLKGDGNFETAIVAKSAYIVKLAYLQRPANWGSYTSTVNFAGWKLNFGTWTKTKYKLILDALYDPIHDTTVTEFNYGTGVNALPVGAQYLQTVKNYIKTNYPGNYNNGVGAYLKDPDQGDQYIQVGNANY